MVAINASPNDESLWNPLEDWLGAERSDHNREAPADSWFINDARGVQVARSPRSEASRGENYSHRDYFHGQGADLPANTANLKPIDAPHLSAVYRSTSTGHLKVAFSVPIEYRPAGGKREVVGVLAMAVDLGEFNVLEKELPPGHEVVLIDLRESDIDGQKRRGLVLHHQGQSSYRKGQPPPWIDRALLARIDETLKNLDPGQGAFLGEYRDDALTDGELYWGAMKPVVEHKRDEPPHDLRWLVIVQEPVSKD